jgi:hypothetical protein
VAAFVSLFYPLYYFAIKCGVIEPSDFSTGAIADKVPEKASSTVENPAAED